MLRIFLIFLTIFCLNIKISSAQITENNSYDDFKDLDGNYVESFVKTPLRLFSARRPTPARFYAPDLSMPDSFVTSNNLAKKVGAFYRAFGEVIFIQGTVTDSFGVPIHNAIIEIWQANSAGKYHTLLESNSRYIDKYFNMSGKAITDNIGNYFFITIMPGSTPGRAPHINMNVFHPKFGKLETEMYFEGHPLNKDDYQYMAYDDEDQKLLTANVHTQDVTNPNSIKVFTFDITMKGIHKYKKF